MKTLRTQISILILFISLFLSFQACNNNDPVNVTANTNENFKMNFAVADGNDNSGNLQITEAKALLSKIQIFAAGGSKELQFQPMIIRFDLNGGVKDFLSSYLSEEIYTGIHFQIHKPNGNETISDPDFYGGINGNKSFSVIIKGTYNGTPFIYKVEKTINIIINFDRPITVSENMKNMTVLLQKNLMFLFNGIELDPTDPHNQDAIDESIKQSFVKAFEDNNRDGTPDN